MTRKRFIKLLMSHGESLHSARAIAFLYNSSKTSYKEAYRNYLLRKSIKKVIESFLYSMGAVRDSIMSVAESLGSSPLH